MKNNKYGLTVTSIKKYGFKTALAIWEKYDKKCSVCGTKNKLAVHHIDESGKSANPNNDITNLQLMCISCHLRYHQTKRMKEKAELRGGYLCKGKEGTYYRDKMRQLRAEGRIKPSNKSKQYRELHKDIKKEYNKKYFQENKEKWKKYEKNRKSKHLADLTKEKE